MDRSRSNRRDPGGRNLGIHCIAHQQPGSAVAGADHGRRCPVPALPGQGRHQCSRSVHLGPGALLCGDRGRDPQFLSAAQTQGDSHKSREGEPDSGPDERPTALATGGCTGASRGFSTAAGRRASPGPRYSVTRVAVPRSTGAGQILVAAGAVAAAEDRNTAFASKGSVEASKTEASQGGLLQHRWRTDQSDGRRVDRPALASTGDVLLSRLTLILHPLYNSMATTRANCRKLLGATPVGHDHRDLATTQSRSAL